METTMEKTVWEAGELWLLGIDTPDGIHCCLGGCSAGTLDLTCDCNNNRKVREELRTVLERHPDVNPGKYAMDLISLYDRPLIRNIIDSVKKYREIEDTRWKLIPDK